MGDQGDITLSFGGEVSRFAAAAEKIDGTVDKLSSVVENFGKKMGKNLGHPAEEAQGKWGAFRKSMEHALDTNRLKDWVFEFGRGMAQVAKEGLESLAEIDRLSTRVSAVGVLTKEQMEGVNVWAEKLAQTSGTELKDIYVSMEEMLSAGWGAGATKVIEAGNELKKAGGGFAELRETVKATSIVLKNFSEDTTGAADAADWLIAVYQKGQISVGQLADAMSNIGPQARAAGLSLNEVGASISLITSEMGTDIPVRAKFPTMLVNMSANWSKLAKEMGKMGIDTTGIDTYSEKLDFLKENYDKLTIEMKKEFVGAESLGILDLLIQKNTEYHGLLEGVADRTGKAKEAADQFRGSLAEQLEIQKQINEAWKRSVGEYFKPLQDLIFRIKTDMTGPEGILNGINEMSRQFGAFWGGAKSAPQEKVGILDKILHPIKSLKTEYANLKAQIEGGKTAMQDEALQQAIVTEEREKTLESLEDVEVVVPKVTEEIEDNTEALKQQTDAEKKASEKWAEYKEDIASSSVLDYLEAVKDSTEEISEAQHELNDAVTEYGMKMSDIVGEAEAMSRANQQDISGLKGRERWNKEASMTGGSNAWGMARGMMGGMIGDLSSEQRNQLTAYVNSLSQLTLTQDQMREQLAKLRDQTWEAIQKQESGKSKISEAKGKPKEALEKTLGKAVEDQKGDNEKITELLAFVAEGWGKTAEETKARLKVVEATVAAIAARNATNMMNFGKGAH